MKNIIIVGAGFSGLSLAYHLNKKGFLVSVIDKNKRSGGMISTASSPYGLYETAANGFLNTEKLETFLEQVNASYVGSTTQAKKRFIFRGKPLRWPLGFTETCHFIIKLIIFLIKSNDLRQAQPGESVQSWSNRHFTTTVTENLIAPALQGIYAGDIEKLSAELVINPMILKQKKKRKSASSLLSALGGMGSLMKDIEKYLIRNGVQFVFGKSWSPDIASDILVIATSASDATSILQKLDDSSALENAALLKKVAMEPLISATCFFEKAPSQYQGFGILFPRGQGVRPLGVLMNDLIFNRPAKAHSETWILGGALDRQIIDLPDAEIINLVEKTHGLVFDETQKVLECQITRWPRALPHYTIEHNEIITQLKPMKKVFLHGNYLGRLGLSRLLEQSEQLAEVIAKDVV